VAEGRAFTWQLFFAIPVAVFEIILLPTWLLCKGFKSPTALGAELPWMDTRAQRE
jgi:hypothetical protein